MRVFLRIATVAAAAGCIAACSSGTAPSATGYSAAVLPAAHEPSSAVKTGKLITIDTLTGSLEYWPIEPNGGSNLRPLSGPIGVYNGYNMAANGNLVAIANYAPAEIVTYNVRTKRENVLADPYGGPVDLAIDRQGTIYALNLGSVAVFKAGSSPAELTCSTVNDGIAVAVDNESDVFVNGYGPNGFMGVVEFRAGSTECKPLTRLRRERGYVGGIGIDPKTDDLIVVDDPDECAGGLEGRMLIYIKPYRREAVRWRNLGADYCAGTIRLDATSTHIFVSDATISAGFPLIDQRTYPGAEGSGIYEDGPDGYSGYFSGFTTIPNTLPN
jgi:hypothetical protein